MKTFTFLSFVISLSIITAKAHAQTADEIIQKYIAALGGLEKIQAVKTLKLTGTLTRGNRFETEFVRYWKHPNLFRNEMEVRGQTMVQAFDGQIAWGTRPFRDDSGPQELPEGLAQNMKRQADFFGPLVNYREKGFEAKLVGKEEFEGTQVYKLELSNEAEGTFFIYLDTEHFMEIKRVFKKETPSGEMEIVSVFSDYKSVNDIMVAHVIETKGSGFGGRNRGRGSGRNHTVVTIDHIEVNTQIDDGIFKMPEK